MLTLYLLSFPTRRIRPLSLSFSGSVIVRCGLFLALLLWALPATAQPADSSKAAPPSVARAAPSSAHPAGVDVWVGRSLATGHLIGKVPESSLDVVGIRYRHVLGSTFGQGVTVAYTGGVVGARLGIPRSSRPLLPDSTQPRSALATSGVGITPIGVELAFHPRSAVRPFISGHMGFIYFFESVPDRQGKNVNFTASLGVGIRLRLFDASRLTVGYRYHHTSNGFRGQINPGVDANLFYAGVTLFPGLLAR